MQPEYVSRWELGGPTYRAALPAPMVHYLTGQIPECRLIAVYCPTETQYFEMTPKSRQKIVRRRLHLDYASGQDPLGNPYWRSLEDDTLSDFCQTDCQIRKALQSLLTHLAAALGIPTAAEVEAGLVWHEVPESPFPAPEFSPSEVINV